MYKPLSSSPVQLIAISQKVRHQILFALARTVAVEQLEKRKKQAPVPEQKKKTVKKAVSRL